MRNKRLVATTAVFLVTLLIGLFFISVAESSREIRRRKEVQEIAFGQAQTIRDRLNQSLSATFALAAIIRQRDGTIDNFDGLARQMLREYNGVTNLQLAPNGVVSQIYPLKGNEAAIGHNLLTDPKRKSEALRAIETRKLTLAGPFTLVQGGVAVIGRLPVFITKNGQDNFWGFTNVLIKMPQFLKTLNLSRLTAADYDYQLWRINPDTKKRDVFGLSTKKQLSDPVTVAIEVPGGRWNLSVSPKAGWRSPISLPLEIVLILLISSLCAFLINRLVNQTELLRSEVDARTEELRRISETNQQIADTLQQGVLNLPKEIAGLEFGYVYRSATLETAVGGDFFDLYELADGKVGIIIGDVSGKGLTAATFTSIVKNGIKAYSHREESPAAVMDLTNRLTEKSTDAAIYVSAFFAILETETGKITYCNAGHPSGIVRRREGEIEELIGNSPVIGTFAAVKYRQDESILSKGDTLILYTDGLIDARQGSEFFGEDRLKRLLLEHVNAGTRELPEIILNRVLAFTNNQLVDDLAILAITRI